MTIAIDVRSPWDDENWKPPALPAWAKIWGFDSARWGDFDENLPTNNRWPYSDEPPGVGTKRTIYVCPRFRAVSGYPIWVLYLHADSGANGWDECPDDIDFSSLVLCDLVEVLKDNINSAWITVEVLDVIPLPDLLTRFDESHRG